MASKHTKPLAIHEDVHARAKACAEKAGVSLRAWTEKAMEQAAAWEAEGGMPVVVDAELHKLLTAYAAKHGMPLRTAVEKAVLCEIGAALQREFMRRQAPSGVQARVLRSIPPVYG